MGMRTRTGQICTSTYPYPYPVNAGIPVKTGTGSGNIHDKRVYLSFLLWSQAIIIIS